MDTAMPRISRRTVSLLILCSSFLLMLWLAADVLLAIFAGILLAVFLRSSGDWVGERVGLGKGIGLAIFLVALAGVIAGFLVVAGTALADQAQKLLDSLPEAIAAARGYVDHHGWLRRGIDALSPRDFAPSPAGAFSTTFGAFGNAVVILFVGLYGAGNPGVYARGAAALLAPSLRPAARDMMREADIAMGGWLRGQFVSMAVVGVLTAFGLWALGVPLALILAVLAAVLTFIPNVGPVLAALPAVLIGLSEGPSTALWIAGLYIAVQGIESYLVTPHVQKASVSLPPALTIAVQLFLGALFGIMGLALATPLAAVALRLGSKFYVNDYLDRETPSHPPETAGQLKQASSGRRL